MSLSDTAPVAQKPKFTVAITTESYQNLINNTLGDPERAKRFIASITSSVAVNPQLQECDAGTILAGALLGESLNLSPSPQLGQYYLVPFDCKVKDQNGKVVYLTDDKGKKLKDGRGRWIAMTEKRAQFILGYKGYIQLAIRSGQYRKLNVLEIKEGELLKFDPLNEEIECRLIEDTDSREMAPTIGYYAMFEYLNGFRKAIYWSRKKVMNHADKYSPAFSAKAYDKVQNGEIAKEDMWQYSSFWYQNFDDMAKKTLIRQLISRWGIMSTEMQSAYENDFSTMGFGNNDRIVGTPEAPVSEIPIDVEVQNRDLLQLEAEEVVEKVDLSEL